MRNLLLPAALLCVCAACGVQPPTEDLNVAKAALAKAEEAHAPEFAPAEYRAASTNLGSGEKMIVPKKNKKNETAKKMLTASKQSSDAAYTKAAPAYAEYNITEAGKARTEADDIKASVAVKDRYSEADALLTEARTEKDAGRFESAWDKAIKAASVFREAAAVARKKRDRADEAIKNAESSIRTAEESAGGK